MSTDAFDEILRRADQLTAAEKQRLIEELSDTNGSDSKPASSGSALGPPLTQTGAKLRRIRSRIVEAGEPLLDLGALDEEVAQRRGGVMEN